MVSDDLSKAAHYFSQVDRPDNQIVNWLTGYVLYETGNLAAAVEAWQRAGSALQIIEMGVSANENQDTAETIALFDIVVQVDPTLLNVHYAIGSPYASKENFRLAGASLLRALGLMRLSPLVWLLWGFAAVAAMVVLKTSPERVDLPVVLEHVTDFIE